MRTRTRNRLWMPLLAVLLLALAAFLLIRYLKEEVDPHAGQVYLYDGYDWIWYTPLEGVEPNPWGEEDFRLENGQPVYPHEDLRTQRGHGKSGLRLCAHRPARLYGGRALCRSLF